MCKQNQKPGHPRSLCTGVNEIRTGRIKAGFKTPYPGPRAGRRRSRTGFLPPYPAPPRMLPHRPTLPRTHVTRLILVSFFFLFFEVFFFFHTVDFNTPRLRQIFGGKTKFLSPNVVLSKLLPFMLQLKNTLFSRC